ncbi:MAG: NAD(P)H-dependent oxidoreductase [Bdellovibrionales bacterium]|nr:NAD(P)H-dependent oxidoreductase [Bdellovibrionales bacterium]
MKIAVISASHRKSSRSKSVATWVTAALTPADLETVSFDLAEINLPFWSEDCWNSESVASSQWAPYSEQLKQCDGIVMISPEWAGMIPPKLGNFLLLCSNQELAYKPVLLIGVSAGASGTYPVAQLRMNGSKNNQMIYLPDHLIVRNVGAAEALERLTPRLKFNIEILKTMAHHFRHARETIDLKAYPYGL